MTASPRRICSEIEAASSETRSASTCGRPARALDDSASARASRIALGLLGDEILDREVAEQLHAVAAAALGGGQRAVRAVDEALDRAQRVAGAHRADRDGHGQQRLVVDRHRQRADEPADLLGERAQRLVVGNARHEHDERLAVPAAEHVVAAQPPAQPPRDLAQHPIPDGVAVAVVDAPEVVELEHEHARRHARALGAGELGGDRVEHVAAVVEAGQRVGARAALGLGAAALGGEQRLRLVAAPLAQRDDADGGERDATARSASDAEREPGALPAATAAGRRR